MVLYGFKKQFALLVESGAKQHTIRDLRKDGRHAKPGDKLQLYTGLRTKVCRKLLDAECWDTFSITIASANRFVWVNDIQLSPDQLAQLIHGDGFASAFDFWAFFPTAHERVLICWAEIEWLKSFRRPQEVFSTNADLLIRMTELDIAGAFDFEIDCDSQRPLQVLKWRTQ
jgi:hypothetical protein